MTPDEKNILRKALIEIDYQLKHIRFTGFSIRDKVHAIKKKLLKDLKMPEAE